MPRGRPPKLDTLVERKIQLPVEVDAQLQLLLYSSAEGRVPYGALARLVTPLIQRFLRDYQARASKLRAEELIGQVEQENQA